MDSEHTLNGVLTRLRAGVTTEDPELRRRLDQAFSKHLRGLHTFVRREVRGESEAGVEELVQDVLVEAWRKLPSYRPDAPFRSFLYAIAARKCANARRKRRDALTSDGLLEDVQEETALAAMLAAERDHLVELAVENVLTDLDREIAFLRYVEDYGYVEIADQLALADPDEARVGLQRIRRRLAPEIRRLLAARGHGSSFL